VTRSCWLITGALLASACHSHAPDDANHSSAAASAHGVDAAAIVTAKISPPPSIHFLEGDLVGRVARVGPKGWSGRFMATCACAHPFLLVSAHYDSKARARPITLTIEAEGLDSDSGLEPWSEAITPRVSTSCWWEEKDHPNACAMESLNLTWREGGSRTYRLHLENRSKSSVDVELSLELGDNPGD
jgi:hypothetical protein